MLNTCSIGRRWKSREGWSRPVLTGERGTLFPTLVGRVSSCGGFLVGWQGTLFLVVTTTILVRRLICLRPLSGSRTATIGIGRVAGSVAGRRFFRLAVHSGFAVVMAQVRRPVPFRTRKLRPGTAMVLHSRGCGRVARRRIQRRTFWSSPLWDSRKVPFLFSWGFPPGATPRKPPFFCFAGPPTGAPHPGAGRLFLFPVGSVCFGLPKGIFVIPQRLLVNRYFFRNVLLIRYMIRFSEYGLWNGIGKDGNDVPEHRSAACTM